MRSQSNNPYPAGDLPSFPGSAGQVSSAGASSGETPPHFLWNFIVLVGDASTYSLALAFIDMVTVLPIFFERECHALHAAGSPWASLLRPALLVGLFQAIRPAGWLIPQFISARSVSARPRKKPTLVGACLVGRLPFVLVALYLWSEAGRAHPLRAIGLVFCVWALFCFSEGLAGVPWTYILAEAVPSRRRGLFFGMMQILGGTMACAAGLAVNRLLQPDAPAFPRNFGMLFGLTFVFMMIAETCLALIREQNPRHPVEPAAPLHEYLTQLRQLWRRSHAFRHLVLLQWLAAAGALAIPLYTLYATETLHAPASKAGSFLIAAMIGTVVGSAFSAYINDHLSPKLVVQLGMACSTLTPLAALVAPAAGRWAAAPPATIVMLYHSVFFLVGMTVTVGFTGFTSYLLELAPVEARAQYTGLLNSLNAPVVALPILGTWMARATSSPAVFWLACLLCALGAIASLRLPAIGPIRRAAQAG